MKCALIICLTLLHNTTCAIIEATKTTEVKASLSTDGDRKLSETRVYLEDVVFALKHQNWTTEELPCLNSTLRMVRGLQNFTLWAVWEWDSVSSQPQGLLFGNQFELGNFDECLTPPWPENHEDLRTQYCLVNIVLERTDGAVRRPNLDPITPYQSALDYIQYRKKHGRPFNEMSWGACVPAVCSPRSVERLMETMLGRSHLGMAGMRPRISAIQPCQRADQPRQFDAPFYAFMIVMGSFVAVVFVCTYLNGRQTYSDSTNLKSEIIKACCMKENSMKLLRLKKEGTEVLYGIRFLTMCFITLDHQIAMFNGGPISNGIEVDQAIFSIFGIIMMHNDLFVDTYFLLSGFLTSFALKNMKRLPNPFLFILRRYVRLVVAFAVVVFFVCTVYPYTGSGPVWNYAIEGHTVPCLETWWAGLLMVGNYVNSDRICLDVTWYIPCDFHFSVVAILLFWLYRRNSGLGVISAGALTVLSVLVPGIISYVNKLPAVQLFTYDFIKNSRGDAGFQAIYIKSHTRFAAFLVGLYSGYMFAVYKASGNINRISQKWSILGAYAGLLIMFTVMPFGVTYLWRDYHPIEGALYAALNRPVWSCGVALLVLCCSLGHVPYLKAFLSWYPWVPLSRLTYGLYLVHSVLIVRNVFVTRSTQYNDYMDILTIGLGVIIVSCIAAYAIWLFVEAPVNNLFLLCFRSREKPSEENKEHKSVPQGDIDQKLAASTSSQLQYNLPQTIQYLSKV